MTEIERFDHAVRGSEQLREGLRSAQGPEDVVAYAASNGYRFSASELEQWASKQPGGELSERELETVSGGIYNTTGGGNPSVWSKIKSVWFGVDASFY